MYARFYRDILFPFYETILRRRNTLQYLRTLESSQWHSPRAISEEQWSKLRQLLEHAYQNVPYYTRLFDKMGIKPFEIRTIRAYLEIPLLTKEDINRNQNDLLAQNVKRQDRISGATGGSTGTPLRFALDHNNYEWRQAAVKRVYRWSGYRDGERTLFIWGTSVGKKNLWKEVKHTLDERLKNHKILNSFDFKAESMNEYADVLNTYQPKFIITYTAPLYNLAMYLKENKIAVHSPKSIISAAEKLFPFQRELIQDVFQCPVFETYGCREVTSIAAECEQHKGMHINAENVYVEVIRGDKPTVAGETGEIVLTDLTNYCMPLIRYKNGDIGSLSDRTCSCGRGLPLLESVEGRLLDTLQTPDGKLIPGEFFPHLFKEFQEIEKFQVVQESKDRFSIKIIERRSFARSQREFIEKEIRKVAGTAVAIDFEIVKEIPLTATGKYRVVISKVPVSFGGGKEEDGR